MDLSFKDCKVIKIQKSLKKESLIFFTNGLKKNSKSYLKLKQKMSEAEVLSYKVFNSSALRSVRNTTVESKIKHLVSSGVSCMVESAQVNKKFRKSKILKNLHSLGFAVLALKLNNKIYHSKAKSSNDSVEGFIGSSSLLSLF